ncbi:hypothetical protein DFJ73DRAFT_767124 [Zopfochytrium polystomum]|nr:hypothetical protein DFJ73DRAFT_767124 [Zopfochytrium polystomum]
MVQPNARAFLVSRDRIVDMSASIVDDRTPNDNDRGGDEDVPDTVEEDVAAIRRAYEQMDQVSYCTFLHTAASSLRAVRPRVGGGDDDDGDNSDGSPTHARGPPGAPDETERLRRSILLHEISLLTTELERLNLGAEKLEKPADFELVDRWVKESDAMTAAYEDVLLPALQRDLELVEAEGFILDKELAALTELRRALESEVQEIRNGVWEVNERKRITRLFQKADGGSQSSSKKLTVTRKL